MYSLTWPSMNQHSKKIVSAIGALVNGIRQIWSICVNYLGILYYTFRPTLIYVGNDEVVQTRGVSSITDLITCSLR